MRGHLWSPSYFAVSCGGAPLSIIKQFIDGQPDHSERRAAPADNRDRSDVIHRLAATVADLSAIRHTVRS